MSKTYVILTFALLSLSVTCYGQKELIFKVAYLPNRVYTTEMQTKSDMLMDFKGDEQTLAQMKANGMTLPIPITSEQSMKTTTTTSTRNKEGLIPLRITYDEFTTKQKVGTQEKQETNPLAGTLIEGKAHPSGQIVIDSIHGDLPAETKQVIHQMVKAAQEQIAFPKKPLKVGDEFTQQVPFNIPVGTFQMKMIINLTYKLKSLDKQKALFDIVQDITMDMSMDSAAGSATGSGMGHATFDVVTQFLTAFDTVLDMDFTMKMGQVEMLAKGKTSVAQQVVIK